MHKIASLEKGRKTLAVFFVLAGAVIIYFFWSGSWLPKIESPGEFNDLDNLNRELKTNEEVSRALTPLQGLADAARSLGEIVPEGEEQGETIKNIKSFSKKVWNKIYEFLP